MTFDALFRLFKITWLEWQKDKATRLAAALAYYTAFSLAPVLVIVIAIASLVFGQQTAQAEVMQKFQDWLGTDGAAVIRVMVQGARLPGAGIRATLVSLVLLFVGATGLFTNLKDALNTVWNIQPQAHRGWQGLVCDRIMAFFMVLGVGFVLIFTLVISTGLAAVGNSASDLFREWVYIGRVLDAVFSFSIITFAFALVYKLLPDVQIEWKDVWIGASLTSALFGLGKFLIGLYLSQNSLSSTYGAAGSLAAILLWVNYSAQAFFFGAELTKVYTNRFGSRIRPAHYATALQDQDWRDPIQSRSSPQPPTSDQAQKPSSNLIRKICQRQPRHRRQKRP